jgi:predicted peptidase
VVPLCGYGRALTLVPRLDGIPVWTFHGAKDGVVDPRDTEKIVAALRERRGAGGAEVRFMLVPEVGHAVWDTAYADPALPAWILAQHRNLTARAAAANP